jgi:xeroderma pigmentosum group C-complementing protein
MVDPAHTHDAAAIQVELFGEWQTTAYQPPAAQDGAVPRNAFGNWELWGGDARFLPAGCAHLSAPYIAGTARDCGVDCVEAVVGFDWTGGRSLPRKDGVIVCSTDAERVLAAHAERTRERDAAKQQKIDDAVLKLWRELVARAEKLRQVLAEHGAS